MPLNVARVAPAGTAEETAPQMLDAEVHRINSEYEAANEDFVNPWDTSLLPDDETGPVGALVFHLKRGTDLISADRNGLSDPFCVVRVHKAAVPSWRSRVRTKTLNPVWEQSHEFAGYREDMVSMPIRIKVWDWDVLSLNDPIGNCQVDVSALQRVGYGAENALHFDDIALDGVSHGHISFSVHFELKPVLRLFPGTPLHASAAQALFRRPPADATRLELFRDGLLRILSRKVFLYVAIIWLACLVATIIWIVILFMASLIPSWTGGGTLRDPPLDHAPWSREARSIGLSDHSMWVQLNACFQITTGLFTYLNTIVTPWRLSILLHHHSRHRSAAVGCDFYGRKTAALWFQIPTRSRGVIAWCLCLSVFFHFATQITRFVWTSYEASNTMPGTVPVNVTFGLSIVFALTAGILQGGQEGHVMKSHPDQYPPGFGKILREVVRKWRQGEFGKRTCSLCSRDALRTFVDLSREEKSKVHAANERRRLSQAPISVDANVRTRGDDHAPGEDGIDTVDGWAKSSGAAQSDALHAVVTGSQGAVPGSIA